MAESRLFQILYYLLDRREATASKLAEKFEVSIRTIYRDIDKLSGAGIPVYTTTGYKGGVHLDENFVLKKGINEKNYKFWLNIPYFRSIKDHPGSFLQRAACKSHIRSARW